MSSFEDSFFQGVRVCWEKNKVGDQIKDGSLFLFFFLLSFHLFSFTFLSHSCHYFSHSRKTIIVAVTSLFQFLPFCEPLFKRRRFALAWKDACILRTENLKVKSEVAESERKVFVYRNIERLREEICFLVLASESFAGRKRVTRNGKGVRLESRKGWESLAWKISLNSFSISLLLFTRNGLMILSSSLFVTRALYSQCKS